MAFDPIAAGFTSLVAKLNAAIAVQQRLVNALRRGASYRELHIMANQGLTDLQTAVAGLQALQTAVIAEIQTLTSAAGDPDATVETLAQQINASVAAIQAAIPASAPVPAPAPSQP